MTTGTDNLIAVRRQGMKPADPVAIYLDVPFDPMPAEGDRQFEICIHPNAAIGRLNLAGVVGCSVAVRVPWETTSDERIEQLVARLAMYGADRVSVCRAWLDVDDDRQLTVEVLEGKRV